MDSAQNGLCSENKVLSTQWRIKIIMNAVATVFILNLKISSNLDLNAHVLRKMALLSFCALESLSIMRIRADIKQMREKVF